MATPDVPIYVHRNGDNYGPYSRTEAYQMMKDGALKPDDLAFVDGDTEMISLMEVLFPTSIQQAKLSSITSRHKFGLPAILISTSTVIIAAIYICWPHSTTRTIDAQQLPTDTPVEDSLIPTVVEEPRKLILLTPKVTPSKLTASEKKQLSDIVAAGLLYIQTMNGMKQVTENAITMMREFPVANSAAQASATLDSMSSTYTLFQNTIRNMLETLDDSKTMDKMLVSGPALVQSRPQIATSIRNMTEACKQADELLKRLRSRQRTELRDKISQMREAPEQFKAALDTLNVAAGTLAQDTKPIID